MPSSILPGRKDAWSQSACSSVPKNTPPLRWSFRNAGARCETIADALGRWLDPHRASSLARYLIVVLQGISVQARDGVTREQLEQVVEEALRVSRTR